MQRRGDTIDTAPATSRPEEERSAFREIRRVADWPELERRMAIIARMTSDPPAEPLFE
jgi:hypothetical protein